MNQSDETARCDGREGEKILSIGVEGGGATVYRIADGAGVWRYYHKGRSIALDENDGETWNSWVSEQVAVFESAVDAVLPNGDWVRFHVIEVHQEYRAQMLRMVEAAVVRVRERNGDLGEHFERYGLPRWRYMCRAES